MDQPILTSKRLKLRPFTLDDAKEVQRLAGDPEVAKTTLNVPHPYLDGMAEEWILSHEPAWSSGRAMHFAMTDVSTGTLYGAISLGISKAHNRAEVGYWVGRENWNQGYATEATEAVIQYGFGVLGLHKITSHHMKANPASGRVMQKAGMSQEGVMRQHILKDGQYHDIVVYGLLCEVWR